jgi:phytoene desaturase
MTVAIPGATRSLTRPAAGEKSVVVVGAGLGGLGAAVRLAARGYRVTVLERHAEPGGRAGLLEVDGFRFDTGPSLVLMTEYLRQLFADAGRRLEDYLDLVQLDPNYRIHFADGRTLDVTSRINGMLEGVERIERGAGPRLLRFLAETSKLYRIGLDGFVDRNVHRGGDFFSLRNAGLLMAGRAMQNLRSFVGRFFRSEELRNTFSFQSLYLGLSPYESPAIYSLLPYTEVAGGLFFPMGGIHAIPRALARLARELGAEFRYGAEVVEVERKDGRATGVRLDDGSRVEADIVLVNADLPYAYETLLGEPHRRAQRMDYSCSAFLMYLGVRGSYPQLLHHTLVVPRDLRTVCDDIFQRHRIPGDPAFYVCNPNKTDPSLAPAGHENLFVLVPVPSQDPARPIDWEVEGDRLEARMFERLERFGLTDLRQRLVVRRRFTPADFTDRFGATRGEAFGLAHGMDQVGWFRPHNRHAELDNLYFVGQSTHPGCGIPMVTISARLVAERIGAEHPVEAP